MTSLMKCFPIWLRDVTTGRPARFLTFYANPGGGGGDDDDDDDDDDNKDEDI